jgi:hypothetical protein
MCVKLQTVLQIKFGKAVTILTCILHVLPSNLVRGADYREVVHAFPHSIQTNFTIVGMY